MLYTTQHNTTQQHSTTQHDNTTQCNTQQYQQQSIHNTTSAHHTTNTTMCATNQPNQPAQPTNVQYYRRTAESTYAKKKMYYNMKFKTLKRGINGQLKLAAQSRDETESQIFGVLEPLYREMCELERVMEEYANNIPPNISLSNSGEVVPRPSAEECAQKLAKLREVEVEQLEIISKIEVRTIT